ncbi:hypothetical protein ACWCQZ_47725 [Streptomyces sp. NPDC002285]
MSANSNDIITLTGDIDVGNGYVKGVIQNTKQGTFDEIDLPSAVVSTSRTSPRVPLPDADAASVLAGDFYNQIDCSPITPLVAASDRRIFGRAALSVRGSKFNDFVAQCTDEGVVQSHEASAWVRLLTAQDLTRLETLPSQRISRAVHTIPSCAYLK